MKFWMPIVCVFALLAWVTPARANLVFNGSFETLSGESSSFSIDYNGGNALPNWTATPSGNAILDCLVLSGATTNLCGAGGSAPFGGGFQFYSGFNPGDSPDGGNYVIMDSDSTFQTPLTQNITGLTIGDNYSLTFYQAAAQQNGHNFTSDNTQTCGATGTSRCVDWQVSLGSSTQDSAIMILPNNQDVGWEQETMTFTATATSELLSFLSIADVAPNSGMPPMALLDGVNLQQQSATPEPDSLALIGIGLLAVSFLPRLRKRRQ